MPNKIVSNEELIVSNMLEIQAIKSLFILIFILFISCSGSRDFDQTPTPIGGDERVRTVLVRELGGDYYSISGYRMCLYISINILGEVISVSQTTKPLNWTEDYSIFENKIKNAFLNQIRFTTATKNGKPTAANFRYYFTF